MTSLTPHRLRLTAFAIASALSLRCLSLWETVVGLACAPHLMRSFTGVHHLASKAPHQVRSTSTRSWMGVLIHIKQMRRIDRRIDLRAAQACMAQ